ncbi:MAG: DUF4397 domain-containing protein [Sphingobacteriia bacterium]|nr:MAG: DUF4397 domain-containing protein [Sphingobacteriia bacterium]TAG32207.1 MAG: DUF4397 domain-containing protein [Sphingobacteriia bacterium]
MKLKYLYLFIAVSAFIACTKNFDGRTAEQTSLAKKSYIRFYAGSLAAARNFIEIDNMRLNGSPLSMGGVFPGTSTVTAFSVIDPGLKTIKIYDSLITTIQAPLSVSQNFEGGQYYTIYSHDTSNAVKALVTNDIFNIPTDTTASVKFVNIIYSSSVIPNIDLFSRRKGANIATNIPRLGSSAYIPHLTGVSDTLDIRATGTMTNLATLNAFTFNAKRVYTVVFRGRYESTTGTMTRNLNVIATY